MNNAKTTYHQSHLLRYCAVFGSLFLSSIVSGCFENYGRLKHSADVTRDFKTYQVDPNYKYYFYGRRNLPFAIVGIDRNYHMRSRVWREVDHDTEEFQKMIFWVWDDNIPYTRFPRSGAHITDPSGKKVGIWYSSIWYAAVRFEKNNRIVIMPDTPFLGGPEK